MAAAPLVGLIMGSRSDWETMRHAAETLDTLGIAFEQRVVSAHRTPDLLFEYAATAEERGLRVLIAGAGGAAHLPGMAAAKTALPVLGVPVESKTLKGMDSLLSIVQMPAGVPVGHARDRSCGCCQRGLARGGDPGARRRRPPGAARELSALRRPSRCSMVPTRPRDSRPLTLVGCIGGGQLGRMLGLAGVPLGLRFRFLDPSPTAPAADVGELVVGAFDDPAALARLAAGADVVTYEFENVAVASAVADRRLPSSRALELGQDRLVEKQLFSRLGIPTARFGSLGETGATGDREVATARLRRQGPAAGRSGRGARRARAGRGDRGLRPRALDHRRPGERRRDALLADGGEHAPGRHPPRLARSGGRSHRRRRPRSSRGGLLDDLDYVGVLALELFEVGGRLLANEFAPRVHNTGHWTIEGAVTSQFENHLRAILGLPLGATDAIGESVMVNLIGGAPPVEELLRSPRRPRPSLRQGAAGGAQDRARHARRCRGGRRSPRRSRWSTRQSPSAGRAGHHDRAGVVSGS